MVFAALALFSVVIVVAMWMVRRRATAAVLSQWTVEPHGSPTYSGWVAAAEPDDAGDAGPWTSEAEITDVAQAAAAWAPEPNLGRAPSPFADGRRARDAKPPLPPMAALAARAPREALAPRRSLDAKNLTPARTR